MMSVIHSNIIDLHIERAVIEINGGCNYKCEMCPQTSGRGQDWLKKISIERFRELVTELKEYGLMVVNLEGSGEATLNRDLPRYIEVCTENKVDSFIFSNGFRMRGNFMKDCVDAGLSLFRFSVIGYNRETYTKWMNKDAFETVLENAAAMVDYSSKNKTRVASYHLILNQERQDFEKAQYITNFVNKAGTLGEIWRMHNWSGVYSPEYSRRGKLRSCGRPFAPEITIRAGGLNGGSLAVAPCCQTLGRDSEAVLGSLESSSIKDIWNNENMQRLRQQHLDGKFDETPFCRDCDFLTDDPEVLVWKNSETDIHKLRGTAFSLHDYRPKPIDHVDKF